jgi:hypothetical protein
MAAMSQDFRHVANMSLDISAAFTPHFCSISAAFSTMSQRIIRDMSAAFATCPQHSATSHCDVAEMLQICRATCLRHPRHGRHVARFLPSSATSLPTTSKSHDNLRANIFPRDFEKS